MLQKISGCATFFYKRWRGCITIFAKVCVSRSRKISYGNPYLFQKKSTFEKNLRTIRGFHYFLLINFCLRKTKKLRRGTVLCFKILRVSNKCLDKRRRMCITIFCQNLCLTVPKTSVWQPFSVSEKNGFRKKIRTIRVFTIFCWQFFVSDYRKISWGNTSVFQKNSGIENFFG